MTSQSQAGKMLLFGTTTSPFVRKVRIAALELGLEDKIRFIVSQLSPVQRDKQIVEFNPGGRVPTLVRVDGQSLYDSRVICRYLDSLSASPTLYPTAGEAHWDVLKREAMADELLDAAVHGRYEIGLRPKPMRWPALMSTYKQKVESVLDEAGGMDIPTARFDAGDIALAAALSYLDFRYPELLWRDSHPQLASWFAAIAGRSSIEATEFR